MLMAISCVMIFGPGSTVVIVFVARHLRITLKRCMHLSHAEVSPISITTIYGQLLIAWKLGQPHAHRRSSDALVGGVDPDENALRNIT